MAMATATIEVKLPPSAKGYVLDDTTEEMRKALLLYPSIANNTISHGRAAELLGMRKLDLIGLCSRLGIPYLVKSWNMLAWKKAFNYLYFPIRRSPQICGLF